MVRQSKTLIRLTFLKFVGAPSKMIIQEDLSATLGMTHKMVQEDKMKKGLKHSIQPSYVYMCG